MVQKERNSLLKIRSTSYASACTDKLPTRHACGKTHMVSLVPCSQHVPWERLDVVRSVTKNVTANASPECKQIREKSRSRQTPLDAKANGTTCSNLGIYEHTSLRVTILFYMIIDTYLALHSYPHTRVLRIWSLLGSSGNLTEKPCLGNASLAAAT